MRLIAPLALAVLFASCAGHRNVGSEGHTGAPGGGGARSRPAVSEQSKSLREPDSPYRTVVPGDTLYSIAWETGRDYREVASWNLIPAPYTIKPGQQLRVMPPPPAEKTAQAATPRAKADKPKVVTKADHKATTAARSAKFVSPPAKDAVPAPKPAPPKAGIASKTQKSGPTKTVAKTNSRAKVEKSPATGSGGPGSWMWPADGQVLNRYSESDTKGLDIAGTRGAPVRAAASGRVVYQGSGLRGYGQLIIIKHNDEFLSAYAHNDRIYVKEGDAVQRGQKIADMGSTGTDRVKLHFEIRRQGAPIDPLKYLPRR